MLCGGRASVVLERGTILGTASHNRMILGIGAAFFLSESVQISRFKDATPGSPSWGYCLCVMEWNFDRNYIHKAKYKLLWCEIKTFSFEDGLLFQLCYIDRLINGCRWPWYRLVVDKITVRWVCLQFLRSLNLKLKFNLNLIKLN